MRKRTLEIYLKIATRASLPGDSALDFSRRMHAQHAVRAEEIRGRGACVDEVIGRTRLTGGGIFYPCMVDGRLRGETSFTEKSHALERIKAKYSGSFAFGTVKTRRPGRYS